MWNVNAKVIPVKVGTTGTISQSLRQYLSSMAREHGIGGLKKISHIWHCTYTAESVNMKIQNIRHRE
jgi:hypothetical protein